MGRPNLLVQHLGDIVSYFDQLPYRSFTLNRLYTILESEKITWGIHYRRTAKSILEFLIKNNLIQVTEFNEKNAITKIYSWKTRDEFTVITGLKTDSYFMYYSSLFLHGLTQQIPKTYYLNTEHSSNATRITEKQTLSQDAIDTAFAGEQRKSLHSYTLNDKKIIITNGKNTNYLGVIINKNDDQYFQYTDLERTMIDVVVRPAYSGGVFEILEAYRQAKGKLNVQRMASYLKKLNYIYPYHQAIGFYLEKAGYPEAELALFDHKNKSFQFYLNYGIRNKEFSTRWNLYYPKGF
ncbi:hypothetical protein QG516_04050 [Pedobacter gandavensis]|uniref:type IV toxin-antitoxin system AbiEi family antitoxin domain-containing protein n=1 Tax=Pedobacter gandavensis TaxID=2679963 RepID=UPI00247AE11F|nr:hypothetical protein [Pedobacter gandavensis]WGQ10826.1 hypothetical protein QG516_04050 [Pedobacter gandavensis]